MKVDLFTPYGPFSQESGLIYLLANYLKSHNHQVTQLRCNGVFATCERDSETNWRRDFNQCFQCIADQQHLQRWSSVGHQDLSSYISPEIVGQTKRVLGVLNEKQLALAHYEGIDIKNICLPAFKRRVGAGHFDPENKKHEQVFRELLASAIRMYEAGREYFKQTKPHYLFVSKGTDILAELLSITAMRAKVDLVTFRWDASMHAIVIRRENTGKEFTSELVLDGVSNMRSDQNTWPEDLVKILEQITVFLGLQEAQLSLPISRATASAA